MFKIYKNYKYIKYLFFLIMVKKIRNVVFRIGDNLIVYVKSKFFIINNDIKILVFVFVIIYDV